MTHTDRIIEQRVHFSRNQDAEDSIHADVHFSLHNDLSEFRVTLPASFVVAGASGMERNGSRTLQWDGYNRTPHINTQYSPNAASMGGYQTVDKGTWAIISRPTGSISVEWAHQGASFDYQRSYHVDGPGIISEDGAIAYLGPYREYEHETTDQRFRLAVPEDASLRCDPEELLKCLGDASRALELGPRDPEVLVVAAPASRSDWGPGGTQFGQCGFWGLDRSDIHHPNNIWIHEYVHTRQGFDRDGSIEWFIEGTAKYYSGWCSVQQGLVEFDSFRSYLDCQRHRDAILSDPTSWPAGQVKYTKGRLVTAALDAELRERSGGDITLMSVTRMLNNQDGVVTQDDLANTLNRALDQEIDSWLQRYVTGTDVPDLPDGPAAYGLSDGNLGSGPDPPGEEEDAEEDGSEKEEKDEEDDDSRDPSDGECPICETSVEDDDEFCPACGTLLIRECHVCGGQAPGQHYCPLCGTKLVVRCDVCGNQQSTKADFCSSCGTEL